MEKNSKQKEEFARRLAEDEKKKEKGNIIRAKAFLIDFNAPQAGYYYQRTRIANK